MTSRDDMVIVPKLGPEVKPNALTRAREERRVAAGKKPKGLLRRFARARATRRLSRKRRIKKAGARRVAASRGVRGLISRGATSTAGRAAFANPAGLIIGALIVAGAAAARLGTGRSFSGMGEELNNLLLGTVDDGVRARVATRRQLQGDSDITRIVGQQGKANSQILSIANDLTELNQRQEEGASLIRSAFDVDGTLDILILQARDKLISSWESTGGPKHMEDLAVKMAERRGKVRGNR